MDSSVQSNSDYIEKIRKTAFDFQTHQSKRKARFLVLTLTTMLLSITVFFVAVYQSSAYLSNVYAEYTSGNTNALTLDLLQYKDTYSHFEINSLGNSNSDLLAGGYFYSRDGLSILPNEDLTDTVIVSAEGQESLCGELCTYMNVYGDDIYFRKNSDRRIYRKSFIDGNINLIIDLSVGQFVVNGERAFYIDIGNNSSLNMCSLNDPDLATHIFPNVRSFAVYQDYIILLTTDNRLYLLDMEASSNTLISYNIERFFFNGNLVIQNNQNIFLLDITGGIIEQIEISDIDKQSLVFANNDYIVFSNDKFLYSFDIATNEVIEVLKGYEIYTSATYISTALHVVAVTIDHSTGSKAICVIAGGGFDG